MFIFGVLKNFYLIFFRPSFVSLLLIIVTISLGAWQLKRLEWKNSLIQNFKNLEILSAKNIDEVIINEFIKIRDVGTIDRNNKVFFPAKTLNGKAGMRMISEFTSNNGKKYLIDEGWFDNSKFKYFVNNNDIIKGVIVGYIRYPRKAKLFTPKNNPESNEWYTYNLKEISNFLGSNINQKFFIRSFLFGNNYS